MIRLLQGNCIELLPRIRNGSIDLAIADPPYNVYENETVKMAFQQRKKNIGWDQFDEHFLEFSITWIDMVIDKLNDNGSLFIFGGVNFLKGNDLISLIPVLRNKLRFVNLIVWYYHNGSSSRRFFSNRYELIAWFAKGEKYKFDLDAVRVKYDEATLKEYLKDKRLHPENVMKGKNPTNVWEVNRINANSGERLDHPTQKPEEIIRRILLAASGEGDWVLDPFAGSGTTLVACQALNRNCLGIELDDAYFEMARARCGLDGQDLEIPGDFSQA
jgi:site-specific DNA-methyltransferase (adenine-specific)